MANTRVYIGVSANTDIEINKIGTLFGERESNSSVSCTAGCCIIARQHTGDENANTTTTFAKYYFEVDEDGNIISN